jgi:hypothetical protein
MRLMLIVDRSGGNVVRPSRQPGPLSSEILALLGLVVFGC